VAESQHRLGQRPAAYYRGLFETQPFAMRNGSYYCALGGDDDDLSFEVHLPIEFGRPRTDLAELARTVVDQVVEMDDAVRGTILDEEDPLLAWIEVREFFVRFEYYSSLVNTQWAEYFTRDEVGVWRHRGMDLPWMTSFRVRNAPAILAVDAAYSEGRSAVAGVYFRDWASELDCGRQELVREGEPAAYEPGAFYKRELPLVMSLLDQALMPISAIVIDGYVWLSGDGEPGFGARLYEALGRRAPIIGVAKTKFHNDSWSQPVCRGQSETSLYVTSAGLDRTDAARCIASMVGPHRMPTLLKNADGLARKGLV